MEEWDETPSRKLGFLHQFFVFNYMVAVRHLDRDDPVMRGLATECRETLLHGMTERACRLHLQETSFWENAIAALAPRDRLNEQEFTMVLSGFNGLMNLLPDPRRTQKIVGSIPRAGHKLRIARASAVEELRNFEPDMAAAAERAVAKAKQDLNFLVLDAEAFAGAPKKSIDFAVMERTGKAAVVPADIGWSDVGNWEAVWQLSERDGKGNSIRGRGVVMNASNVHVRSDEHLTTVVGVDDVIVITTQDAVLVLNKAQGDSVKQLVDLLKTENRPEALEHKRSYRPWGYYQSVDSGARHQVKRIVVKPGERLSLQKHFHRAEHWVVVKGTAEVTRANEIHLVHENEFDLFVDRLRASHGEPRPDRPRIDRGSDRLLPRRRRYCPALRRL